MNFRLMTFVLGEIAIIIGALMCIPLFMAIGMHEDTTILAFGIAVGVCLVIGVIGLLVRPPKSKREMRSTSGFAMCGLFWIFVALISAIPFRVSGYIPNYIDALFETVSGYTTTGSSILTNVEALPKSLLFWRAFTQFIGGMGVLVFVIALIPKNDKMSTALAKAEVPGPQFGKLVSKLRFTSMILYAIYVVLTLILVCILCGLKMPVFDSFCTAFSTASTGGFSVRNASIAAYNSVGIEVTLTVFMLIFSVNFNVYYLILVGHFFKTVKNEELGWFFGIYFSAVAIIITNLCVSGGYTFVNALRDVTFNVASLISTSGFGTADFTKWPVLSQVVLLIAMCIGGCAGSTAGGLKVSRFVMLGKTSLLNVKKTLSPRSVCTVKMDGKPVDETTLRNAQSFFIIYISIIIISTILVSIGKNGFSGEYSSFETNFSAVIACFNNIGPGIGAVGPTGNFAGYNIFAKLVLCFDMLLGRLEIFPILLLFTPNSWKKAQNKIQGAKKRTIRKIVKKYSSRELERDALENESDDQVEAENSENVFAEETIPQNDEHND
ncbi:MAG: TrkH family potassium uptake protein [Christensenella sp.]|nr:MAG: TrkH family potassium uptake protein [Christensenella sp.]